MAGSNEVSVIDYDKRIFVGKIPVGSRPVHIYLAPGKPKVETKGLNIKHDDAGNDSDELWVGNDGGDSVTIIDGATLAVKATVKVGKGHHKMAFTDKKAYVSNITDGTITVIERGE
jgi:YVTN family beta-propeller protein